MRIHNIIHSTPGSHHCNEKVSFMHVGEGPSVLPSEELDLAPVGKNKDTVPPREQVADIRATPEEELQAHVRPLINSSILLMTYCSHTTSRELHGNYRQLQPQHRKTNHPRFH